MSESAEELKTAAQGASEVLTETGNAAEQLSGQATELADEAAGHGWHGMATRMQEVAEALEMTAAQISTAVTRSANIALPVKRNRPRRTITRIGNWETDNGWGHTSDATTRQASGTGEGWTAQTAVNGKGRTYQRPGALGNADMMRIMDGTPKSVLPLQAMIGQAVTEADSSEAVGSLVLHFDDGTLLTIAPDQEYEAWTAAGPSGEKLVCLPGGGLAIW